MQRAKKQSWDESLDPELSASRKVTALPRGPSQPHPGKLAASTVITWLEQGHPHAGHPKTHACARHCHGHLGYTCKDTGVALPSESLAYSRQLALGLTGPVLWWQKQVSNWLQLPWICPSCLG